MLVFFWMRQPVFETELANPGLELPREGLGQPAVTMKISFQGYAQGEIHLTACGQDCSIS